MADVTEDLLTHINQQADIIKDLADENLRLQLTVDRLRRSWITYMLSEGERLKMRRLMGIKNDDNPAPEGSSPPQAL